MFEYFWKFDGAPVPMREDTSSDGSGRPIPPPMGHSRYWLGSSMPISYGFTLTDFSSTVMPTSFRFCCSSCASEVSSPNTGRVIDRFVAPASESRVRALAGSKPNTGAASS